MPKIGETIKNEDLNKLPGVGGRISNDALAQYEDKPVETTSIVDRVKRGFADQAYKEAHPVVGASGTDIKSMTRKSLGGVAESVGNVLPFVGGLVGGFAASPTALVSGPVGPVTGAAIGTTAGEASKRAIGQALGVRGEETPLSSVVEPVKEGAWTFAGGKVLQIGGGYLLNRMPKLLGIITGEDTDVIKTALKFPAQADKAIQDGDEVLRRVVNTASEKSIQLRANFIQGHKAAFDKIAGSVTGTISKGKDIISNFNKLLQARGVKVSSKGALDFTTSKIIANPGEITKIQTAYDAIKSWKDFSMSGVNELKQLVGALTKFPAEAGGSSKSPVLGSLYRQLDDTIKANIPKNAKAAYTALNKKFAETIDLYDDMVDAFNKGDPFTKIAGVFGKNRDNLRMLVNFYEQQAKKGGDITGTVAGRELGMEKQGAFGILNPRNWIDFLWSPQSQARTITGIAKSTIPAIQKTVKTGQNIAQQPLKTLGDFLSPR